MIRCLILSLLVASPLSSILAEEDHSVSYAPAGEAKGKHIVLLAGDEEYRSEEAMPALGKILSQRHGFKCTVLFSTEKDGTINPDYGASLTNPAALDSADAIVILLRFRQWSDAALAKFDAAIKRGVPIIALRTSTHAFNGIEASSPFVSWNWNNNGGWGKQVLGETWVSHWGKHKFEATRGVIEPANAIDPILRGVTDVFGTTDVYEVHLPDDAKVLMRGLVLGGMTPESAPLDSKKTNVKKVEQGINDPAMPIAWTRLLKNEAGTENKIFCTTMGAASDLPNESLRRLIINGVYWGLGLEVPDQANVEFVGDFQPTAYGFKGYQKGVKTSVHALK